jgi:acyl-CoA thioesterase-1
MPLKSFSRRAPLLMVLFSACAASSGNGSSGHDANIPSDGSGAGATGTAGGGTAGAPASGGSAGESARDGGGGLPASGGSGGVRASDHDAAISDAAPDASSDVTTGEGGISHPPFTGTVKIMVLGSSNEEGTCWRAFLWQKLRAAGITNFDFVGRNNAGPDCGVPGYDKDSEAHGGTVVENISADAWLTTFKANPPDIILQHNGGADLLSGLPYMNVIKAYTLSVTQVRMVTPHVIYFAAQHTPQGNAGNLKDVMVLNAAMVPWAAGITTPDSPVVLVDLFTGIDQKVDMSDGTHLNVSGSQKVSDRFLAVLLPILKP